MAVDGVIVLKPSQVKIAFCALTALAVFFLLLVRWLPGGWLQGFCAVSGFLVLTASLSLEMSALRQSLACKRNLGDGILSLLR